MKVSVSDAKAQLTELVRRAEAGEEVILTRHGQEIVRLTPVRAEANASDRRRAIATARAKARLAAPGPAAVRSQDFLYGEDGLPA
jgi:prevent-host-death family protein